jgi:septal ring factor EnvC (AmiA/AmiB activator)
MMKRRIPWIAVICLVYAVIGQGLAVPASRASKLEQDLRKTRKKIQTEKQAVNNLERKSRNLLKSLEDVDKDIVAAERKLRISRARLADLQKEKKAMTKDLKALEGRIQEQRYEQGRRLVAYYRLGKAGMLPLIFSDASPPEKFRNLDALKAILVSDWQRIEAFHELFQEKERLKSGLQERLEAETVLLEKLGSRKTALEATRQEKSTLLFGIEQDRKLRERLIEELRQSAKVLEKKMQAKPPSPAKSEGGDLAGQKGKLPWPVRGKVYRRFEEPGAVRSKGIDIKTKPGAPVRAVWGGGVVYADWFRGYGKLMIIHHGKKDYTVAAHMSQLTKRKGERVEIGEIVGHAGETGSMDGCLVHFEVWHRGRADDPLKWLQRGGGGR